MNNITKKSVSGIYAICKKFTGPYEQTQQIVGEVFERVSELGITPKPYHAFGC